jgi:CRP-like cAMP-binding protein
VTFHSLDLKAIPLFANIPDAHLEQLVAAFERRAVPAGETLIREGTVGDSLLLLVDGEVEVRWDGEPLTVRPFAAVGELAALAGMRRATTAVATVPSQVLSIPSRKLFAFFQDNGDIGFRFHDNLMHILADKIDRDRQHIEEMKANLVETQKAMKRMRDALLESEDTTLHRTLFEELDAHIEHNRRGRYLTEVPRALPIRLRIDAEREVRRISNEKLFVAPGPGAPLQAGAVFAGVLCADGVEIPVSGTVDAPTTGSDLQALELDVLIEESAQQLEKLLARLQLLDVVL